MILKSSGKFFNGDNVWELCNYIYNDVQEIWQNATNPSYQDLFIENSKFIRHILVECTQSSRL